MRRGFTNVSCVTARRPNRFMGRYGADSGMKEGGQAYPEPGE